MKLTSFLCLLITLLFLGAASAYADTAVGDSELHLLESLFSGNLGLLIGLGVAIMGIFSIVQGSLSGGITLIVLGVLITLTPGVYNGVRMVACPLANAVGGHCGSE